jgi:hypothetical protein
MTLAGDAVIKVDGDHLTVSADRRSRWADQGRRRHAEAGGQLGEHLRQDHTVRGGTLELGKSAGVTAVPGD